jgi:hypothetical protein
MVRPDLWIADTLWRIALFGGKVSLDTSASAGYLSGMSTDAISGSDGFSYKDLTIGRYQYRLYRQEISVSSPVGTTFGVFVLPTEPYAAPLAKRIQSSVETEDEMWQWTEGIARAYSSRA